MATTSSETSVAAPAAGQEVADAIAAWEAQAEHDISVLISDYLDQNPTHVTSQVAADLRAFADLLEDDARARSRVGRCPRAEPPA